VIKFRWLALPAEQREGIKNYIATVVIKVRLNATHLLGSYPLTALSSLRAADVRRRGYVSQRPVLHQQAEHHSGWRAEARVAATVANLCAGPGGCGQELRDAVRELHAHPEGARAACAAAYGALTCPPSAQLLSEEVFDFSRGELTQAKTKELKQSLNTCAHPSQHCAHRR